jgi:hypothetical protein
MVNSKEQTLKAIQELITYVAGIGHFDQKNDVMNSLMDIEWTLREPEVDEEDTDIWDNELHGGIESPWSD